MNVPSLRIVDGQQERAGAERQTAVDAVEILGLAEGLSRAGEIAVIDVDAERGEGDNLAVLQNLCSRFRCRVGGGIRTQDRGRLLLRAGAEMIIISHDADMGVLRAFRSMHVILELDLGGGDVKGTIAASEAHCSGYLCINVPLDGETGRVDVEAVRRLSMITDNRLCLTVDDVTVEEVASLDRMGVDVQVNEALQSGLVGAAESFASCVRWGADGTVPTVVQDTSGQVLMLASSSWESLVKSLRSGEGTYHSAARGTIWRKGERTGHDQLLLRCVPSCDRTALHFLVRQAGMACERGTYSCFGDRDFSLDFLSEITATKKSGDPASSYTARLLGDPQTFATVIREKTEELVGAEKHDETLWAIADLVYFLVVKAVSRDVDWSDVVRELRGRQR
jgi:phosphoribosyl-ATP pyrophosphohydrolase